MKFFRNLLVYFATFALGALSCIGQAVRFEVTEAATGAPLSTLVNLAAGTPTNIRVTVLDETGQPVTSYAKDVTVSFRSEFGQQTDLVVLGAQFINGVAGADGSIAITPEYSATQRVELDNNGLPYETGARASVTDGNIITDNASGFFSVAPARFDVTYSGTDTPLSQHKIADQRSYLLRVTARNADVLGSVATGYRGTVNLSSTSANITVGTAIINFGGVADLIPMQTDQAEVGVSIDAADAVTNTVGASATFEIGVAGTSGGDATRLTVANLSFRRGGTAANQFTILVYRLTNSTTQPTIDPIAGPIDTHFRLLDPTGSPIYIWSEESTTGDLAASGGNTGDLTTSFNLPANMRPGTYTIQVQPGYGARNQGTINVTLGNSPDLAVTQFNYVPGQYRGGDALRMDLTWQNLPSQFPSANTLTSALAADAGHAYMIEVHLSTNPTYGDEDDFLVWQESFVGNGNNVLPAGDLLPGQQVDITRYIKLPENLPGTYYLLARVNSAGGVNGTGIADEHVPGVITAGNNTVLAFEAQKITLLPKQATNTFRVSLTNAGAQAGGLSDNAAISRDGQYVVFESLAQLDGNPVVANITNIYLRNVEGGATSLVSIGSGAAGANGASGNPEITADGRYVVFQSQASNLVPGDTNGVSDIFIRDVQQGITRRVSVNPVTGTQANNGSQLPSISADGRYVVFESGASNLSSDTVQSGVNRVYILDRDADNDGIFDEAGATATSIQLVTKPAGLSDLQTSTQPRISADGNFVAFVSRATVLLGQSAPFPQIIRWDRQADTFLAVTRSLITPADLADNESGFPAINADGSYVAFASRAQNLTSDSYTQIPAGSPSVPHVFRAKLVAGTVTEVLRMNSRRDPAVEGVPDNYFTVENAFSPDLGSFEPSMSDDGQLVAFASESLDLLPPIDVKNIDRTTLQTRFVNNYFDNNDSADVYLYDFSASTTPVISRASVSRFGYEATKWTTAVGLVNLHIPVSRRPVISGDGRYVAFTSDAKGHSGIIFGATNYDYTATNDPRDIYVYDRKAGLPAYSNLPQVSMISPAINELSVGETFTFVANASSAVRAIASVEFYANNRLIGTASAPASGNVNRYSVEWVAPSPGAGNTSTLQYQISAIAVDSNGLRSAISNFVDVTVKQVSGTAPSVVITSPVGVTTGTVTTPTVLPVGSSIPFFARVTPGSAAINSVKFYATNAATGANLLGTASALDSRVYGLTNYINTLGQGSYVLTAVVTDSAGNIVQSTGTTLNVTAAVTGTAPTGSLAFPTAGSVQVLGQVVSLQALANDVDGAIASFAFYANGILVASDTTAPFNGTWTPTVAGTYSLVLVITDAQGASTVTAPVSVTVTALVPPTVSTTAPLATVELGSTLAISASAADADGTITRVVFTEYFGSVSGTPNRIVEDRLAPYGYQFTPTQSGTYLIVAEATDNQGNTTSAPVLQIVVTPNATAPTIEIVTPIAGTTAVVGQDTTLEANVELAIGADVNEVSFYANGTQIGVGSRQGRLDRYRFVWRPSVTGIFQITAEVVDSFGSRGETTTALPINVIAQTGALPFVEIIQPVPPAATGGTAGTLTSTNNSDLNLAASAVDSDGTIGSVEFYLNRGRGATATAAITFPSVIVNGAALQQSTGFISGITVVDPGIGYLSPPTVIIVGDGVGATAEAEITNGAISRIRITSRGDGYTNAVIRFVGGGLVSNLLIGNGVRDFSSDVWRLATPFNFREYGSGFFTFQAVAKDDDNNVQESGGVSLTVGPAPLTTPVTGNVVSTPATVDVNGQRVPAGQTVQLALNPTVVGGSVASVEFFANGESVGIDTTAPYIVNWIPAFIGSYNVVAVVVDSAGNQGVSPALPVYVGGNVLPTITLIRPAAIGATGVVNQEVLLEAEAVALTPGALISSVEFVADGESVGIAQQVGTSNRYVLSTWRPVAAKAYSITARVVDSFGQAVQTPARVLTVIAQTGVIPTVIITSPANVSTGGTDSGGLQVSNNSSLFLSAQANDADGSVARVEFLISRGRHATASAANFFDTLLLSPIAVTSGGSGYLYPPRVSIVGNGVGAVAEAIVSNGAVTAIRLLSRGSGYTSIPQVVFEGGGLYENLLVGTSTNAPGTLTWSTSLDLRNYDVGPYTFRARATDNAGNTSISAAVPVVVTAATAAAPVINLSSPAPATITLGQASNLSVTASSAVGTSIAKVDFYANGVLVSTATTAPYLLAFTAPAAGNYQIYAIVTDSAGNTSVSAAQSLTVNALVGTAPTVTLTDTTAIKLATSSRLPLSAVVTLGNSPVSTLRFFASNIIGGASTLLGSGTLVAGSTTYQLIYTNALAAGDYTLYAVVTDTNGNIVQSATRSVSSVSVTAPTVRIISPAAGSYNILDGTSFAAASARVTTRPATNPTFSGDQDITGVVVEDAGLNYAADVTAYIEVRNDPVFGGGIARTEPLTVTLGANGVISGLALATGSNARLFFYQSAVVVIEDTFNIPALTVVTSPTSSTGVETVRLYSNGVLIGSKASPPYTFAWSPSRAGTYSLHAEITDSDGITSASETVIIVINPAEEIAPVETLAAIESAYQTILGRSPTNDETVSAVNRFGVGLSAGQVAALLLQSSDFRDDQAELLLSYLAVWGEYPTAAQYDFLESQRDFELTDVQIVDSLLASVAYKGRFGDIADLSTVNPTQYSRIRALALRTYRNLYGKDSTSAATSNIVAQQFFYSTATLLQTPGQAVVNFINLNFAGGKGGPTLNRLRVAGAILLIGNQQPTKARIDSLVGMPLSAVADYYFEGGEPYTAGTMVSIDTATGDEPVGVTYHASGLPKGLTMNRTTGVISGRLPASIRSYSYSYWTQLNGVRGQSVTRILVVDPLDSKFVGTSEAILLDDEGLPAGKLAVRVTTSAAYTGTLAYGDGRTYSFKGVLSVVPNDEGVTSAFGEQSPIKRKAPLTPLQVDLFFGEDGNVTVSVTEGEDVGAAAVGEAIRVFTFTKSAPAPWQGSRTVEMSDVSSDVFFSEGAGSGTLKVAQNGTLSVALRGEDGAKITATVPSSVSSDYRLYTRPYSKKPEGYFAGSLKFSDEASPSQVEFPEEGNDLTWLRPADVAPFTDGFGPLRIRIIDTTE